MSGVFHKLVFTLLKLMEKCPLPIELKTYGVIIPACSIKINFIVSLMCYVVFMSILQRAFK